MKPVEIILRKAAGMTLCVIGLNKFNDSLTRVYRLFSIRNMKVVRAHLLRRFTSMTQAG